MLGVPLQCTVAPNRTKCCLKMAHTSFHNLSKNSHNTFTGFFFSQLLLKYWWSSQQCNDSHQVHRRSLSHATLTVARNCSHLRNDKKYLIQYATTNRKALIWWGERRRSSKLAACCAEAESMSRWLLAQFLPWWPMSVANSRLRGRRAA